MAGNSSAPRARRDPVARRQAIVEAAADQLLAGGDFTHRRVAARAEVPLGSTTQYFATLEDLRQAAVDLLVERAEGELDEFAAELDRDGTEPAALARGLLAYLEQTDQLSLTCALYGAALTDPSLRPAVNRWLDGQAALLAPHIGAEAARAVAMFLDGAVLHTVFREELPSEDLLIQATEGIVDRMGTTT